MAGYYYKQLNKQEKTVYDLLRGGFDALQPMIRVPKLEGAELAGVYTRLKLDEPLLFYVVDFKYRFYPGADHVEFLPEYLFDKGKVKEHRQAIAARMERLARPLRGLTPLQQEQAIHDFILESVQYDKLKKPYSHEVIGPLTQGVGVCEGIAKTVKALCDAVGLECIIALSEANCEKGVRYRHAWNVVTVNKQHYHIDATFDNTLQRGGKRYDYFNLDDRHMFIDHEKLVYPVPECRDGNGYFYRSLSFTKPDDVENRFAQALRKGHDSFIFHWRGGGLNHEIFRYLLERCNRLAEEKGKKVSCSVNVAQSIIQLEIGDREEIYVQQPDEAENTAE